MMLDVDVCEVVAGGDGPAFGGRPPLGHMMVGPQSQRSHVTTMVRASWWMVVAYWLTLYQ